MSKKKKHIDPADKVERTYTVEKENPTKKGERRSVTGIKKKIAAAYRKQGTWQYPDSYDPMDLIAARDLEEDAEPFLKPLEPVKIGAGKEALPQQCEDSYIEYLKDTLKEDPNQINVDASLRRVELAGDALVLEMALDASESIQARNSLEKMLAHQMAACHHLSMRLITKATGTYGDTMDLQRLVNSSVRLMNTYQQALQTIHKLRTGGRQVVTVQHVNVKDGGQAVVAGSMKTGGGESSEGGGENVKK